MQILLIRRQNLSSSHKHKYFYWEDAPFSIKSSRCGQMFSWRNVAGPSEPKTETGAGGVGGLIICTICLFAFCQEIYCRLVADKRSAKSAGTRYISDLETCLLVYEYLVSHPLQWSHFETLLFRLLLIWLFIIISFMTPCDTIFMRCEACPKSYGRHLTLT